MGRLFDLEESGSSTPDYRILTNDAVAAKICDLESGGAAAERLHLPVRRLIFTRSANIVEAGDHIVCASALYGGTYNLYVHTIRKMGVEAKYCCLSGLYRRRTQCGFSGEYKSGIWRDHCQSGSCCVGSGEICQRCSRTWGSIYCR